jgi:uncharacterized NAD-dependent epimerase/dehydratase family protein
MVYCEGAFNTPSGKTAHGLVRFTERYQVLAVVDARWAGSDAGLVLDGKPAGIPVVASLGEAAALLPVPACTLVIGLAPDGGRLPAHARTAVLDALQRGWNVDSGLHDFLSEDPVFAAAAQASGARIRDIRKPPPRNELHFFSGCIEQVGCLRLAVLGTDSALGKRTTAWILVHALRRAGYRTELIGTGQTAWLQGARYSIVLDSLVNDFVSGELEHAVCRAWKEQQPDVLVIEGQGSLMNPAYPGGFEILAAGRPHGIILQHAPARRDYDGFPGYPIHPLDHQIRALECISGKPVLAIAVNHEDLGPVQVEAACKEIHTQTGLPAWDVLLHGAEGLVRHLQPLISAHQRGAATGSTDRAHEITDRP